MEDNNTVYTGEEVKGGAYQASPGLPMTFRERLDKRFGPTDFVRVINPDNEEFVWQGLDPKDESYFIDRGPMKNTTRNNPHVYRIQAGQSLVLEGWNAQLMIEKLYRKLKAKKALARREGMSLDDAVKKSLGDIPINWGDAEQQEYWIDKIFVGVEHPSFGVPTFERGGVNIPTSQPVDHKSELDAIAKDLGIE
jgi:hypothetical protein